VPRGGRGVALALWLPAGPLAHGWARRAGTPVHLIASARRPGPAQPISTPPSRSAPSFTSPMSGQVRRGVSRDGTAVVDLALRTTAVPAKLRLRLAGAPLEGGGLQLEASAIDLVDGATYTGRVTRLAGNDIVALVAAPDGRATRLRIRLVLRGPEVQGTVTALALPAVAG
jgi:hypothetical protein